jgi:hypothetical protein
MEFTPITEEQAKESQRPAYLLKPGMCEFEVKEACAHSKRRDDGTVSESIKLTLTVWDQDGKEANVFDYISPGFAAKFRHAFYAMGLGHAYESARCDAESFIGKGGQLLIRTKQDRGYEPKNDVADYVVSERAKTQENYQTSKTEGLGAVAVERARTEAKAAFKSKHAMSDANMLPTLWKGAFNRYFPGRSENEITVVQWRRFMRDGFEPQQTPVSPAGSAFTDEEIPFPSPTA